MMNASLISTLPPDAAVLLVLLAAPAPGVGRLSPAVSSSALARLQQQLGTAVRVLRIDEASHPSVVSSFHATDLPCFVLVHRGVELWRAYGAPNTMLLAPLLLSKLELLQGGK